MLQTIPGSKKRLREEDEKEGKNVRFDTRWTLIGLFEDLLTPIDCL